MWSLCLVNIVSDTKAVDFCLISSSAKPKNNKIKIYSFAAYKLVELYITVLYSIFNHNFKGKNSFKILHALVNLIANLLMLTLTTAASGYNPETVTQN